MDLTSKIRAMADIRRQITEIEADSKSRVEALRREAAGLQREIQLDGAQLDVAKIALARTVVSVRGEYARAGDEKASVIADAVHQIATGEKRGYGGLDGEYFGTKNYDRWHGQRSDHEYGYGPGQGSIIFSVGLAADVRRRGGIAALTDEEREAAVYLLTRLEAVQAAERVSA